MGRGRFCSKSILLVKPMTFMNRSGEAVGALARFYRVGGYVPAGGRMGGPVGQGKSSGRACRARCVWSFPGDNAVVILRMQGNRKLLLAGQLVGLRGWHPSQHSLVCQCTPALRLGVLAPQPSCRLYLLGCAFCFTLQPPVADAVAHSLPLGPHAHVYAGAC